MHDFMKIGLELVVLELGLRTLNFDQCVELCCWLCFLSCLWCYVVYKTCKRLFNHFGSLGDQNGVFGWERICEIVGF